MEPNQSPVKKGESKINTRNAGWNKANLKRKRFAGYNKSKLQSSQILRMDKPISSFQRKANGTKPISRSVEKNIFQILESGFT